MKETDTHARNKLNRPKAAWWVTVLTAQPQGPAPTYTRCAHMHLGPQSKEGTRRLLEFAR